MGWMWAVRQEVRSACRCLGRVAVQQGWERGQGHPTLGNGKVEMPTGHPSEGPCRQWDFPGVFRTKDPNLKFEAIKLHEIIKGGE